MTDRQKDGDPSYLYKLLLLRKFLLVVMFVIISLMVLSSLGIDIGPLIAGAGVIGLAIGFDAQTLVKDIIAGIFFLIDDAFRVGDYIEAAGQKGMVEHISIRSLRLRNPKGMIHTIPFGGMGNVTNFSRDYIITKLDFLVRSSQRDGISAPAKYGHLRRST